MKKLLSAFILAATLIMLLASCTSEAEKSYDALDSFITSRGTSEHGVYELTLGENEKGETVHERCAKRTASGIDLILTISEDDEVLYTFVLSLNKGTLGTYTWDYYSESGSTMGGTISAEKYTKDTYRLEYLRTNIRGEYAVESATKIAKSLCDELLSSLEKDLAEIEITAKSFGFKDF